MSNDAFDLVVFGATSFCQAGSLARYLTETCPEAGKLALRRQPGRSAARLEALKTPPLGACREKRCRSSLLMLMTKPR